MAGNKNLYNANRAKQDEFYTQLVDIEKELRHYKKHFKDKIVFCNCDDPFESNFFKYFAMNFNFLGLKKLIATCYDNSPVAGDELPLFAWTNSQSGKKAYKIEITEVTDENGDGAIDLADVELLIKNHKNTLSILEGNGDFRSEECIELLKEADIVVTNPPFSLFREYVTQLVQYDKKFIIIGNKNAITYKEIFPLIKENRLWIGLTIRSGDREFRVPQDYVTRSASLRIDDNGNKYIRVPGVHWFTNLDYPERHEDIILYKRYTPEEFPKYDNYDAINVDKTSDIPYDYDGVMGVPITFLDKYNPEQFEIIGLDRYVEDNPHYGHRFKINGKETYARILIRRKGAAANEN
ncbi:MAG: adenine-specific methyltransferase EcoRI family protein [Lentisphaeria bacterium]|nr:adenine-specific methyltransferase EcoRI family protein [Lentisphaeria bacterium]